MVRDEPAATTAAAQTGTGTAREPGAERLAAASSTALEAPSGALTLDPDDLEFEIVLSALYHRDRETFFAAAQRLSTFISLIASSGAVASLVGQGTISAVLASLVAGLASASALAFDFGGKARTHAELRQRIHDIAANLAQDREPDRCRDVRQALLKLTAVEPPPAETAHEVAFAKAAKSLGRKEPESISRVRYFFRHIW